MRPTESSRRAQRGPLHADPASVPGKAAETLPRQDLRRSILDKVISGILKCAHYSSASRANEPPCRSREGRHFRQGLASAGTSPRQTRASLAFFRRWHCPRALAERRARCAGIQPQPPTSERSRTVTCCAPAAQPALLPSRRGRPDASRDETPPSFLPEESAPLAPLSPAQLGGDGAE